MRLSLALVLLSGCLQQLPPPAFTTACGMRVRYAEGYRPETWARLARGEDIALAALNDVEGITRSQLCAKLARYTLQIGYPSPTSGAFHTECTGPYVALRDYSAEALTHELAHVADNCSGYQEKTGGVGDWLAPKPIDYHHRWKERGVYSAIGWAAAEEARK